MCTAMLFDYSTNLMWLLYKLADLQYVDFFIFLFFYIFVSKKLWYRQRNYLFSLNLPWIRFGKGSYRNWQLSEDSSQWILELDWCQWWLVFLYGCTARWLSIKKCTEDKDWVVVRLQLLHCIVQIYNFIFLAQSLNILTLLIFWFCYSNLQQVGFLFKKETLV